MRTLIVATGVALLLAVSARAGEEECSDCAQVEKLKQTGKRLRELSTDISIINLLNGLRLTPEQSRKVLALARRAEAVRTGKAFKGFAELTSSLERATAAYQAFKAEAIKGEPPRGKVSRDAARIHQRLKQLKEQHVQWAKKQVEEIDAALRGTLTEGQLRITETFKACLIPPKDLRDPVRAGQASGDRGMKILGQLRRVPAGIWNARKDGIADRHVAAVEKLRYKMLSDAERAAAKKRFIAMVEKIRAMSDTDFELEKGKIAEQFKGGDRMQELIDEIQARSPRARMPKVSKAGRWLLNPQIIPILEARLKLLAKG
jgi:hypothetical protein